jgi:sirohydrochlorin ferrochelatase
MIRQTARYVAAGALLAALFQPIQAAASEQAEKTAGILILAHGGKEAWNNTVTGLASAIDPQIPTEVAFGMASRPEIQAALDRLHARGVREITAVPLFISSHSSVIESTRYLLGLRPDAPPDLAIFAKMNHGSHGAAHAPAPAAASAGGHEGHHMPSADNTAPVTTSARIRMAPALDAHETVGEILTTRARAISKTPASEVAVLVAHGPVPEDDNDRWLANMRILAGHVGKEVPFARVDYLTVRDDAPEPIRGKATAELRKTVEKATAEGHRVLIVPLLLSYGGIEQGIRKRLEGLTYTMSDQGLMPDDRLRDWVLESARPAR